MKNENPGLLYEQHAKKLEYENLRIIHKNLPGKLDSHENQRINHSNICLWDTKCSMRSVLLQNQVR